MWPEGQEGVAASCIASPWPQRPTQASGGQAAVGWKPRTCWDGRRGFLGTATQPGHRAFGQSLPSAVGQGGLGGPFLPEDFSQEF